MNEGLYISCICKEKFIHFKFNANLKMISSGSGAHLQKLVAERQTSKSWQSWVTGFRGEGPAHCLGETKSTWGVREREDFLQEIPLESWGRAVCQAATDHPFIYHLSIHPSSIYSSTCPFIIHLSTHPYIHPPIHLSVDPSVQQAFMENLCHILGTQSWNKVNLHPWGAQSLLG